MLSKALNIIATLLMALVILLTVPLTIPRLFGYQIYGILTESMEPVYPVGSVVYVKPAEPEDIQVGDAITFRLGTGADATATHRVEEIDTEQQQFITKGDANASSDVEPVPFSQLVGKVTGKLPWLGRFSVYLHSWKGIAACIVVFAAALILWKTAEKVKLKESKK